MKKTTTEAERAEKKKAYNKMWAAKNRAKVAEYGRKYYREGIEKNKRRYTAYKANNPEKRKAQDAVKIAIRNGTLIRKPCEVCGKIKVDAHHDDYSKPLEVRWLCRSHHKDHHYKIQSLIDNPTKK
jgi:hypothetical protein